MKPKRFASALALLFGIFLLGYLWVEPSNGVVSETQVKLTSTAAIVDDPVGRGYLAEMDQYRQDLTNPNLTAENRKIVEANLQFAEQKATQRATAIDSNGNQLAIKATFIAEETKNPSPLSIQKTTINPLPARGIHGDLSFVLIRDASFHSAWVEPSEKDTLWFLGGCLTADKDQGVVYVFHAISHKIERYFTPSKSGLLRTIGLENNQVIFKSEQGETFYFEISARQFVDANGKALPTLLPAYPVP